MYPPGPKGFGYRGTGRLRPLGRSPCHMPYTQYPNLFLTHDPVSNNIRICGNQFAHSGVRYGPPTMREMRQAVARLNQPRSQDHRSPRIEVHQVRRRLRDFTQGARGPYNQHAQATGGGTCSPAASFSSHSRTRSCGMPNPASISASASASAIASEASSWGRSRIDIGLTLVIGTLPCWRSLTIRREAGEANRDLPIHPPSVLPYAAGSAAAAGATAGATAITRAFSAIRADLPLRPRR